MITSIPVLGGVAGATILLYILDPLYALGILGAFVGVVVMLVKMSGMDKLITPLGPNEVLGLVITKTRKIKPEILKEDEGYLQRNPIGQYRVVSHTDHTFAGKRCALIGEGIPYTLQLEYAKMSEWLWKLGIHSPAELATVLGVPRIIIKEDVNAKERKTEKDATPEPTGIAPVNLGQVFQP